MKASTWSRVGLIAVALVLCASITHAQGDEMLVSNVQALQRPGTHLVDVTYDLATVDGLPATVNLWLSTDGGATFPILCVTVSGDVGEGILSGNGHHIVWDAGVDAPGLYIDSCQLRVTADDGVIYEAPNTTTIIPEEDSAVIQSYDPDGTVMLDAASQYAQDIEIGDVLIGENAEVAPNGLLLKVISKTTVGESVVLETAPALMTEAFEMMELTETHRLRPSSIVSSELIKGARLIPDKDDDSFIVQLDCVFYDQDGNQNTTDDQIKIYGEYQFTADLFATIEISEFGLQRFEIGIATTDSINIGFRSDVTWQFPSYVGFTLASLPLGAIPLGGVVWLVPTLSLGVNIRGDVITCETSISYTQEILNGFGCANDEWYVVNDSTRDFTCVLPTVAEEASYEPGVSLKLNCLLYGVAGPFVGGKTGFRFESVTGADPCVPELLIDLDAIYYASVGVTMSAWVLSLNWSYDYELYAQPIAEQEVPIAISGVVIVDIEPESLNAPWAIEGPCGYVHSGNGDATLTGLLPGEYTVTWGAVAGWIEPPVETHILLENEALTFNAVYVEDTGPAGFVHIPPGTFTMGSPPDEPGHYSYETLHTVTLTQGFYIARTEVTEEWWDEVMGSGSSTSQLPKAGVSWDAAVAFCNQLSLDEGLTPAYTINGPDGDVTWNRAANGYRLPTEAEWEYACRAGSQAAFCNGPITHTDCTLDPNLDQMGWYCGNSGSVVHAVGQKSANAWGLHDMHGNLWEWVWDGYRSDYENLPSEDPAYDVGPGAWRVVRSGYWDRYARGCRSAYRDVNDPSVGYYHSGFRPVRSVF